jgi:hypothetical protein
MQIESHELNQVQLTATNLADILQQIFEIVNLFLTLINKSADRLSVCVMRITDK